MSCVWEVGSAFLRKRYLVNKFVSTVLLVAMLWGCQGRSRVTWVRVVERLVAEEV